ncbi:MAG TPA: hypothetical protein VJV79_04770 [Polyangiaceae bacterium]|nr:hypothetical protein [Polyangiaceae bacterium]
MAYGVREVRGRLTSLICSSGGDGARAPDFLLGLACALASALVLGCGASNAQEVSSVRPNTPSPSVSPVALQPPAAPSSPSQGVPDAQQPESDQARWQRRSEACAKGQALDERQNRMLDFCSR